MFMVTVSEVAIGAKYCVGRVESLLEEDRGPGLAADHPREVGTSRRVAIPSYRCADALSSLEAPPGTRGRRRLVGRRESLRPDNRRDAEGPGRGGPPAVALAACRPRMAVGVARPPPWTERLASRRDSARSDPSGDAAAAGEAAWMAHFRGRRGRTRAGAAASRSTRGSASERGRALNYARRQRYRRLSHASNAALGSAVTALLGLVVGGAGAGPLAGLLLLTGGRAGPLCSPLAFARSPESSRRPLGGRGAARASPLQAEGWRLRHSLS